MLYHSTRDIRLTAPSTRAVLEGAVRRMSRVLWYSIGKVLQKFLLHF